MRDPGTPPSATMMARAALALYPPSWRSRYGDEVHALLDECGGGARAIAGAAVAIFVAVIGLSAWARGFAGYQDATLPWVYLALVVATAAVTAVSAARGARAALAEQAGGAPVAGG
jgi:hypothetical protein